MKQRHREIVELLNKTDLNRSQALGQMSAIFDVGVKSFLYYILTTSPSLFYTQLLILLPEIFRNFSKIDFIKLIESLPARFPKQEFMAYLTKFLNINGLQLLAESNVLDAEKIKLFSFFRDNITYSYKSKIELDFLSSPEVGITSEHLKDFSEKLINEKDLPRMISMKNYIEFLNKELHRLNS